MMLTVDADQVGLLVEWTRTLMPSCVVSALVMGWTMALIFCHVNQDAIARLTGCWVVSAVITKVFSHHQLEGAEVGERFQAQG